jgi:hypothetical protein
MGFFFFLLSSYHPLDEYLALGSCRLEKNADPYAAMVLIPAETVSVNFSKSSFAVAAMLMARSSPPS